MIQENTGGIIRFIPHQQIDKAKWNACILSSSLPLIYATSSYLDGMSKHWDALVMGDYDAVMPLPNNRKWLIDYIYSPYFVVAGGVFGKDITEATLSAFVKAIPKQFRYVDLDLNEHNYFSSLPSEGDVHYRERKNTYLNLNRPYHEISSGYTSQAKRKIKKAAGNHFSVDKSGDVSRVVDLYKKYYTGIDSVIAHFDFTGMVSLLNNELAAQTRTYLLSFPNGEIAAFYLLLFDENFVYWLIGGSSETGKEKGAFYYMTDLVIQEFAGTNRTFRFEGSDQEGIHFFNRQFGGQTVYYPHLQINRLPWPLQYLK